MGGSSIMNHTDKDAFETIEYGMFAFCGDVIQSIEYGYLPKAWACALLMTDGDVFCL